MKKKQKIALGIGLGVVFILSVSVGVVYFAQPTWLNRLILNSRIASGTKYPDIDDGLHALLVGTGSPMPDANRAGPSTLVIAGTKHFVVDTGSGSTGNLVTSGIFLH